jgi:hypothetical protein
MKRLNPVAKPIPNFLKAENLMRAYPQKKMPLPYPIANPPPDSGGLSARFHEG